MSKLKPKIVISRQEGANWTTKGLRPFLEYRDLGLAEATEGRVGGSIGRAIKKFETGGGSPRHVHDTTFHLIFVMRGWFRSNFDGLGEVTLRAGDLPGLSGRDPAGAHRVFRRLPGHADRVAGRLHHDQRVALKEEAINCRRRVGRKRAGARQTPLSSPRRRGPSIQKTPIVETAPKHFGRWILDPRFRGDDSR